MAVSDSRVVGLLEDQGMIAFRYMSGNGQGGGDRPAGGRYPANPNGSAGDIAGLCDTTGAVVGLMPHPEDHVVDWQRPGGRPGARGLPLFKAFVDAAR